MNAINSLDLCPGCGRRILDWDMTGCETDNAQRWCVKHLPEDHPMAHLKADLHLHDYPWIRRWGLWMGSFDYHIELQLTYAREDDAPQDAIYKDGDVWKTTEAITNPDLRQRWDLDR